MIFEGVALEVVNALKQDSHCWSRYGKVIEDSRVVLNSFQYWFVSHTCRANKVAHNMAKNAISL